MKKRFLCLIISALMILCTIPVTATEEITTYSDYFPFEDVPKEEWYAPAVGFCYVNSYVNGVSDTRFSPSSTATREQMIMILANILAQDISEFNTTSFTDVEKGSWYFNAVAWAEESGYTQGIGNGLFGVGKNITREEAVVIFYKVVCRVNSEVQPGADISSFDDDENLSEWALEAMQWAVGAGVIQGNNNLLNPKGILTRAEATQIIYKILLNCLYTYHQHEFSEATCTEPAKCISTENVTDGCDLKMAPAKGHRVEKSKVCEEFSYCLDCGELVFDPQGHNYVAATCTEAMTCSRCGKTEGKALGHTSQTELCLRCGKEFFANDMDKLCYYLNNRGIDNGSTKYFQADITYSNNSTSQQFVRLVENTVYFENIYSFARSSDTFKVKLTLNGDNTMSYTVEYFKNGSCAYSGSGTLNASTYTSGAKLTLSVYNGNSANKSDIESLLTNAMTLNLEGAALLLKSEAQMNLSDLGFANFE